MLWWISRVFFIGQVQRDGNEDELRAMAEGGGLGVINVFAHFPFFFFKTHKQNSFTFTRKTLPYLLQPVIVAKLTIIIIIEFSDMLRYKVNSMTFFTKIKSSMAILAKHSTKDEHCN